MLLTKLCLLATVVTTSISALVEGYLPYYPIEISRTACGKFSHPIFVIGILISGVTMVLETKFGWTYLAWTGLAILAIFDDASYWGVHMMGVGFMVSSTFFLVLFKDPRKNLPIFVCAMILYLTRIVMRTVVVLFIELELPFWSLDTWTTLIRPEFIFEKHMKIMYNGAQACKFPHIVLPIFRVSGILQWLPFYIMATIY